LAREVRVNSTLSGPLARLAITCFAASLMAPASASRAQSGEAIEVQVLDAETLRPIPNVRLVVPHADPLKVRFVMTGEDGVAQMSVAGDVRYPGFGADGAGLTPCGDAFLNGSDSLTKGVIAVDTCDPEAPARAGLQPVPRRVMVFATPSCCVAWTGPPPEVRVLVLDGFSGRPMRHAPVDLMYLGVGQRWPVRGLTDPTGVFRTVLHDPIGRVIAAGPPGGIWRYFGCSGGTAMTEVVLQRGFAGHPDPRYGCRPNGRWPEPSAEPGELIIYARQPSLWKQLLFWPAA